MDADRWAKVKDIFSRTVDLAPDDRHKKLDEACNGDAEIRQQVEDLLRSNDEVEGFIEEPAFTVADALPSESEPTANKLIGHYRVVREIGRGGMGTVFLATRDDGEFQQEVAIKVVSSAFLGRESLRRFRQERQILAGLNHPNIARLLDGGVTDDDLPYLVMEYVAGDTLIEYADRNSLSVGERLSLFTKVCRAVAYAHGSLIVHRDIKPSNIIVPADGEPKLLDFGLAKMLDIDNGDVTATNFRALTPAYASPEQIRGEPITTASDIYSLGVVLYELLTGTRPFDHDSITFEKIIEIVSGSEPRAPSEASSQLRGDIDNIVLMAIRSEPDRRYRSVEQFANDIERHLAGLPIFASDDTLAYRASKFIRRHRIGVASAAAIVLLLLGGIMATTWQASVANRERDQARREKEKAEQLNTFLQSILSAASPQEKGKDAKVIEVLDDAAARLDEELANQPELKAKALTTIGKTYAELGLPEKAEPKLREALGIYQQTVPKENRDRLNATLFLAESLVNLYRFDDAEQIFDEQIDIERSLDPPAPRELSYSLFLLGELRVRQARFADAETALNESIPLCDSIGPAVEYECAYYRISLGRVKQFSGDLDAAEAVYRKSLAVFEQQSVRHRLRIADLSVNLGDVLITKANYSDGIRFLKRADETYQKDLGDSLFVAVSQFYLSRAYLEQSDNAAALKYSKNAVDIARKVGWVENRNFIGALRVLGLSLTRLGKAKEGEPFLREALDRSERYLRPDDTRTADVRNALAECLDMQKSAR